MRACDDASVAVLSQRFHLLLLQLLFHNELAYHPLLAPLRSPPLLLLLLFNVGLLSPDSTTCLCDLSVATNTSQVDSSALSCQNAPKLEVATSSQAPLHTSKHPFPLQDRRTSESGTFKVGRAAQECAHRLHTGHWPGVDCSQQCSLFQTTHLPHTHACHALTHPRTHASTQREGGREGEARALARTHTRARTHTHTHTPYAFTTAPLLLVPTDRQTNTQTERDQALSPGLGIEKRRFGAVLAQKLAHLGHFSRSRRQRHRVLLRGGGG